MEIIQQNETLSVKNIDYLTANTCTAVSKHGCLLPDVVRSVITGSSNSGKTNVLFNLITHPNGLKFNNVYIFSKSLTQPKYQLLRKILTTVEGVKYFEFNSSENILHPHEALPYSVIVFDDVSCENQTAVKEYFSYGRHYNIDVIYIGQTYSKISKQLIRDNINLLIMFRQDYLNLKHIFNDHVSCDMTFEQFKTFCSKAWEEKYGFAVIDKEKDLHCGRYRIGFDKFAIIR